MTTIVMEVVLELPSLHLEMEEQVKLAAGLRKSHREHVISIVFDFRKSFQVVIPESEER